MYEETLAVLCIVQVCSFLYLLLFLDIGRIVDVKYEQIFIISIAIKVPSHIYAMFCWRAMSGSLLI